MICCKCGEEDNTVTKTLNFEDFIKRYRKCKNCGHNWSTYEIAKEDMETVSKMFFKDIWPLQLGNNKEEY